MKILIIMMSTLTILIPICTFNIAMKRVFVIQFLKRKQLEYHALYQIHAGLKENIINNKTGWVVQKNKPTSLAGKIEEILEMSQKKY